MTAGNTTVSAAVVFTLTNNSNTPDPVTISDVGYVLQISGGPEGDIRFMFRKRGAECQVKAAEERFVLHLGGALQQNSFLRRALKQAQCNRASAQKIDGAEGKTARKLR